MSHKELVSKGFQDVHIQLNLVNADEKENQALRAYDLILRANDEGTEYTSFDIFNYELQKPIATIKLDGSEAWTYETDEGWLSHRQAEQERPMFYGDSEEDYE